MAKKTVDDFVGNFPFAIKTIGNLLKQNFDENGKNWIDNSTGLLAIIVGLVGKPLVDNYFDKLTDKKLEKYGLKIYLKAGFAQANKSLKVIENKLEGEYKPIDVYNCINDSLNKEFENPKNISQVFNPRQHQSIISIKRSYERILQNFDYSQCVIDSFTKDFNKNIDEQVKIEFGDDYQKHLDEVKDFCLRIMRLSFLRR